MVQVSQLTVADKDGVAHDVATLTATNALIGEVAATPTANTLLGRIKAMTDVMVTALGPKTVAQSPSVNIASDQPPVAVNQKSTATGVTATFTRGANVTAKPANSLVGAVQTLPSIGSAVGIALMLTGARLEIDIAAVPSGMTGFRAHIFKVAPIVTQADNDVFNLVAADRPNYVGYVEFAAPVDLGDTLWAEVNGLNKQLRLASTSQDLFVVLTTNGGFIPNAASEVYKVTLHALEV